MSKTIASIYGKTPEPWILVEVGDLIASGQAELQTGPFGTMLHASAYRSVGTPVVAVQHIGENRLRHGDLPRVDDETRERLARYRLRCFPMDSRPTLSRGQALRGNDGDRAGGHWAMRNERTEQVRPLDAATRLHRTFGGQVAANLKELGYGG